MHPLRADPEALPKQVRYLLCAHRQWPGAPPQVHELVLGWFQDPFLHVWQMWRALSQTYSEPEALCFVAHPMRVWVAHNGNGWFDVSIEGLVPFQTIISTGATPSNSTKPPPYTEPEGTGPLPWPPHLHAGRWTLVRGARRCLLLNSAQPTEVIELLDTPAVRYTDMSDGNTGSVLEITTGFESTELSRHSDSAAALYEAARLYRRPKDDTM
eukprot:TRINITY_DN4875_c0_g2_i1.p1 TRINITY_DN4875_c0_g2~~TRINITY_DN4875_c0_g2_i1.p1  ORF type:complete len:212 (-),score=19.95 TRINITY_DN4875_c0_g2_i1:5-640(-)